VQIKSNGGRNDVMTIKMWALFGSAKYTEGDWAFFSHCVTSSGTYTTSIVGNAACNQYYSVNNGKISSISASHSYMVSQSGLAFASSGHFRGLTLAKLFQEILVKSSPHLFLSSFNEHIGGRQVPSYKANIAFNMGLPNDPQKNQVWVDTYASEFSRDIEPNVEVGDIIYRITAACVQLYKQSKNCQDEPQNLCCTMSDKDIFQNIYALVAPKGIDYLLTYDLNEVKVLTSRGWTQTCNPINGPSIFCVDTEMVDGRSGPFIIYKVQQPETVALYRCYNGVTHSLAVTNCENGFRNEILLGYISQKRGGETLRGLSRCLGKANDTFVHALDLSCDKPDGSTLGYVR